MCRFSCLESIKAFKDIWTCGNFAFLRDQCLLPCNSMVHICLIQTRVRTVLNYILSAKSSVDQSKHVARKTYTHGLWTSAGLADVQGERGPPSFLVLDVSEEDKVSLPVRLPSGALQVAWACHKSGWLARKNSSRWGGCWDDVRLWD